MTTYITGIRGFIGQALAQRLADSGVEVRGLVSPRQAPDLTRGIRCGDINAPSDWARDLAGVDTLFHAAAKVTNNMTTEEAWKINVLGAVHVLDAARRAGVRRVVLFSSIAVYSFLNKRGGELVRVAGDRPLDETFPLMPSGQPYGDSKIALEREGLLAHARGDVEVVIIRPADVYGPRSRPWVEAPLEIIKQGLFMLPAGGRGMFTPLFIDDLVDGVLAAAESPDAAGEVILLGGEKPTTAEKFFTYHHQMLQHRQAPSLPTQLAARGAQLVGRGIEATGRRTELSAWTVRMLDRHYGFSNAKARQLLGWHEQVSLEEGMRRTEVWARGAGLLG